MKDILDHSKPIHTAKDLWHAECGALWWQVSDDPAIVNCPKCKRLLTKRTLDGAKAPQKSKRSTGLPRK
jgi:hypothetical protein